MCEKVDLYAQIVKELRGSAYPLGVIYLACLVAFLADSKKFKHMRGDCELVALANCSLKGFEVVFNLDALDSLTARADKMVVMVTVLDEFVAFEPIQ